MPFEPRILESSRDEPLDAVRDSAADAPPDGDRADHDLPAPLAQLGEALGGQARFLSACYPPQWNEMQFQQRWAGRQQARRVRRRVAALAGLATSLAVVLLAWAVWHMGVLGPEPQAALRAGGPATPATSPRTAPSADVGTANPPWPDGAAGATAAARAINDAAAPGAADNPAMSPGESSAGQLARQPQSSGAQPAPERAADTEWQFEPALGGQVVSGLLSVQPAVDDLSGAEVFGLSGLETPGKRGGF
jgi:hypothetical protein